MYERRLLRVFAAIAALLAVIAGRAFQLQVLEAAELRRKGDSVLASTTLVRPVRGQILWADGSPAVWNESRFVVRIDWTAFAAGRSRCLSCGEVIQGAPPARPCAECGSRAAWEEIPRPTAAALGAALGATTEETSSALDAAKSVYDRLHWRAIDLFPSRRFSESAAKTFALRAPEFPGISVRAEPFRSRDPAIRSIAGSASMALDTDVQDLTDPDRQARGLRVLTIAEARGTLVGHTGFERRYDEVLRGTPGITEQRPARRGERTPPPEVVVPVEDGRPVRTTLRRDVQMVANDIVARTPAAACGAVVLDLADGAVVAVASHSDDAYCRAICALVPGSVFKLVPALASLEQGLDASESFDCQERGWLRPGVRYVCDAYHGPVALRTAFAKSCNHYFMHRAEDVGAAALAGAYTRLGLDLEPALGIGVRGLAPRVRDWKSATAQLGMGQAGALASPLQVAIAYGRLAARGRKIVPYIDRDLGPPEGSRDVDPVIARHADFLLDAAHAVVTEGTGRRVEELRAVDAGGKTGTAEVDLPGGVRLHNAWFAGYAPADAPRFVAVVVHEKIKGLHGSDLAGPDVGRLLEAALRER